MKDFLPDFEDLLQFLKNLKLDKKLFGDFNIDTVKDSKDKSDYENLITAYCFNRQNSESTGVTPTSSTCLGHFSTSPVRNETIKTTFWRLHIDTKNSQEKHQKRFKIKNLKNIKISTFCSQSIKSWWK